MPLDRARRHRFERPPDPLPRGQLIETGIETERAAVDENDGDYSVGDLSLLKSGFDVNKERKRRS